MQTDGKNLTKQLLGDVLYKEITENFYNITNSVCDPFNERTTDNGVELEEHSANDMQMFRLILQAIGKDANKDITIESDKFTKAFREYYDSWDEWHLKKTSQPIKPLPDEIWLNYYNHFTSSRKVYKKDVLYRKVEE